MAETKRASRPDRRPDRRPPGGPGGRPGKCRAVLDGALAVFAQVGYTRASIDAIATAAGVSTRTIYNHFANKAELFEAVVAESTARVADHQVTLIERYLGDVTDLEADLVQLGLALAIPMAAHQQHFALVRQIDADAGQVPPAALDTWRAAGPGRVLGALADRMRELGERGLLRADDPHRAAVHLMVLVQGAVPFHHGIAAGDDPERAHRERADAVRSGIQVFLHGYLR